MSLLIMITGARLQQPRQATVSRVNSRSGVVSPSPIRSWSSSVLEIAFGVRHVAGRAVADLDDVAAHGVQPELRVEGGHPVDLREGHPRLPVDLGDPLAGDVAVLDLELLQERDQDPALAPRSGGS